MQTELRQLRASVITFDAFARKTRNDWERLARVALRERPCRGVEVDDLVQIMLVEAWLRCSTFDPKRTGRKGAISLQRYVVFNACDKAKKFLLRQRATKRGQHVTANISEFAVDPTLFVGSGTTHEQAEARRELAAKTFEALLLEADDTDRTPLVAFRLAQGCELRAAKILFHDGWARTRLGIESEAHGLKLVRTALNHARGMETRVSMPLSA